MDERILKFRVGILVVISMLILGILILTISGKPFFGSSYQISGQTDDAAGISSGTPIKKFGLPIGRVTKVAPSPSGTGVTVWMNIQETDSNGLKQTIDTSAEMAVIGSDSILGDVVINIEPAKNGEDKSQIESEIKITKSNPIEAILGEQGSNLVSELGSLLKPNPDVKTNFGDTVAEIKLAAGAITNMFEIPPSDDETHNLASAIASFQETSDLINAMFEKRKDQKNIYYTLDSLYNTSEAFRAMFQKRNPDDDLNFAMALGKIVETSESINAASLMAEKTFTRYEKIPNEWNGDVKTEVIEFIANASQTVKSLEAKPNSLLEKALTDEKIGFDLNTLSGSLAEIALKVENLAENVNEDEILRITAKLDLLLDDLRFFGDSLARNPGSIVRGALRPRKDTGPKSTPTVIWEEDGYFRE